MEKRALKRVLAVHDISCFGKCSLTVALPIISAAGHECTVLPNALLSTHTGIGGFTYKDLTEEMEPILAHWRNLGLGFDSVFTGFLCNNEQISLCCDIIDSLNGSGPLVFADPAMADNGELYTVFGPEFPSEMRRLCAKADVIKPNITEACLMTGTEYVKGPYTKEWIGSLLSELADIGARHVILTGVYFDEENIGAAAYDCSTGRTDYSFRRKYPGDYVGTGDIFSSAAVSALLSGKDLPEAVDIATDLTTGCIARTYEQGTEPLYGVNFEDGLPAFMERLGRFRRRP